jgi:biofilm PGA synthesis N-glycosyltransferase PgaC
MSVDQHTQQRLLVISPVRNEAAHIEQVALAMAAQTRPPDTWLVVDDHSTDDTREILERLVPRLPFMTLLSAPDAVAANAKDRLAVAADALAFNNGLNSVDWKSYTHVSKLDGDTELPPSYFEILLRQFDHDPGLGLAGGVRIEHIGRRDRLERVPTQHHVPGALKCYTVECFQAIGGMQERLAWDTIDEVYARMRGYRTQTFPELVAVHHRPWGSADGVLRGRARHGRCAYIVYYPLPWVALRAIKTANMRPWGLSGLAYLGGYLTARRSTMQVGDPEFRAFFRRELRQRVRAAVLGRLKRRADRPGSV